MQAAGFLCLSVEYSITFSSSSFRIGCKAHISQGVGKISVVTFIPSDAKSSYKAMSEDAAVRSTAVVPVVTLFESHS